MSSMCVGKSLVWWNVCRYGHRNNKWEMEPQNEPQPKNQLHKLQDKRTYQVCELLKMGRNTALWWNFWRRKVPRIITEEPWPDTSILSPFITAVRGSNITSFFQ